MQKPKLNMSAVTFRHGQMFHNVARNGSPKRLTDPAPAHGMKRQTQGSLHPYLHGQAVNDEAMQKTYETQSPLHPATPSRDKRGIEASGSAILDDAGRLGRTKE